MPNLYTIGYTGKTAEKFFCLLQKTTANKVIDIRLNNSSQLSGFSKKSDLPFFFRKDFKLGL